MLTSSKISNFEAKNSVENGFFREFDPGNPGSEISNPVLGMSKNGLFMRFILFILVILPKIYVIYKNNIYI